jgi:hypothetical protein
MMSKTGGFTSPAKNEYFAFDGSSTNLESFTKGAIGNGGVNTDQPLIINPNKFDKFSKNISKELRDTYMKYVEMVVAKNFDEGIEVEKGLNISMQLVKGFTLYVNDKLEQMDSKSKTKPQMNFNCLEDVFRKKYGRK